MVFDVMSEKDRIQSIADIMDKDYSSVAVTLDTGEILFGDIEGRTYQEYCKFSKTKKKNYIHGRPISKEIVISFPDSSGTKFGSSFGVWIPNNRVSSIEGIRSFSEPPDGYLRNLPNPFSKYIFGHNSPIIERNGFTKRMKMELALEETQTITNGLYFQGYEVIYADWDYFSNAHGGINSIGASILSMGGSVGKNKSLQDFLLEKLQDRKKIFSILFSNKKLYKTDVTINGLLKIDKKIQDTKLDGDTWKVYYIEINDDKTNYELLPLLLNEAKLIFPLEFLKYIKSELTFYGDLRQIPIKLDIGEFDFCLQARAIAHMP